MQTAISHRVKTPHAVLVAIAVQAVVFPALLAGAEKAVEIQPRQRWSAVFGEKKLKMTFDVVADEAFNGRLAWAYSSGERTISRGEVPLQGGSTAVPIDLLIPPVKQGVVLDSLLSLAVFNKGGREPSAELDWPLWIYATNPFVDRTEWLEELKITLYDPTDDEKTVAVFREAGIPYSRSHSIEAIASIEEGMLVVAEGVSLERHRGLGETLATVAARGVPVLCLAPLEGSMPLPGAESNAAAPAPRRVEYRRQDVIRDLDKRLDADAWPPDGRVVAIRLIVKSHDDDVVAEVSQSEQAWPWIEARYSGPGATLVICGFGLVEHWNDGPTPRFLLARLFEMLEPADEETDADDAHDD